MEELAFPYRYRSSTLILCTAFFALCAFVLAFKAQGNETGLIINGLIELAPGGASTFYWLLAGGSVAFVMIGLVGLVGQLLGRSRHLRLTDREVIVPRLLRREDAVIPYADIRSLRVATVARQTFLEIHHATGRASIARSAMPTGEAFDQVVRLLAARAGTAG